MKIPYWLIQKADALELDRHSKELTAGCPTELAPPPGQLRSSAAGLFLSRTEGRLRQHLCSASTKTQIQVN